MTVLQLILSVSLLQACIHLCAATSATTSSVTPFDKVVELLEDLKEKSESEGKEEAKTYGEYACFCKTSTETKVESSLKSKETIEDMSASIELKTATKVTKKSELVTEKKALQSNKLELGASETECEKSDLEFSTTVADLAKAVQALTDAKEALEKGKPLGLVQVRESLMNTLQMAEMMGKLSSTKRKDAVKTMQGVDPTDADYKFHAGDILDTIVELLGEFTENKQESTKEWDDSKKACQEEQGALKLSIQTNKDNIRTLNTAIQALKKGISEATETLEKAQMNLKEDQLYLKDLTKQCEDRAKDFDQRSKMRADEVSALTKALDILKGDVEDTISANARALIQRNVIASKNEHKRSAIAANQVPTPTAVQKPISLLQAAAASSKNFLHSQTAERLSASARVQLAVGTLQEEGQRLNSMALISLSGRVSADPFAKVKELIQKLIERLIAEASGEATKKGFCDTALSKAKKDRDFRKDDVMSLSSEIAQLEAKQMSLENEIEDLSGGIFGLQTTLEEATSIRDKSKEDNLNTISDAKKGLLALNECIEILKTFYRKAGRAFLQASPVQTDGPGFEGNYKGQQEGMKSVMGLLEVIQSDYERTIETRTTTERQEHADFTELKKSSNADIEGKTTKKEMDDEDLATTKSTITSKMGDLKTNMDLLDKALQELTELNPMCVDSGMSYEEREGTRKAEMEALKKALCQLDAEGVEEECGGGE